MTTDLCSYPEFRGGLHFVLYDISAERLAHAERLVRRISAQTVAMCDELIDAHRHLPPALLR